MRGLFLKIAKKRRSPPKIKSNVTPGWLRHLSQVALLATTDTRLIAWTTAPVAVGGDSFDGVDVKCLGHGLVGIDSSEAI
jgi:hypothetical protein